MAGSVGQRFLEICDSNVQATYVDLRRGATIPWMSTPDVWFSKGTSAGIAEASHPSRSRRVRAHSSAAGDLDHDGLEF